MTTQRKTNSDGNEMTEKNKSIILRRHLLKKANELGFSNMKTKIWTNYMLDTKRGEHLLKKIKSIYDSALILDLGCGYGSITETISKKFNVISIDIEYDRVYITKMRSNSVSICADGAHIPFKSDTFDLIIMSDILEHVNYTNQIKICNEAHRVVKKDGNVIVKVPNRLQLFDSHNDFLIFVSIFPDELRKRFLKQFGRSEYCEVCSHTLFGWMNMFHETKFIVDTNLLNSLPFIQNFEFVMKKYS